MYLILLTKSLSTKIPFSSYISQAKLFIFPSTLQDLSYPFKSSFNMLSAINLLTGVPIISKPPIIPDI